ncbi:MAG: alkaline phosphatase family protein [Deltaproteobacteria bacterium]
MANQQRVLIIGLDGVPFDLIRAWADAGYLPNLDRLIKEGVAGPLDSTMPPTSGPSWSSFATGMNPGKTGIYDFLYRRPGSYVFPPVNASMRSGKSLWKILSEHDRRVCVVNLPISYPVEKVNGVLISGWMTPYFATDFTYPDSIGAEIKEAVGDYRIYPSETFSEGRKDAFWRASDELLEMLTATNLYLMRREPWDLFMTVYFDTDRILHQLWHYVDPQHPWRRRRGSAGRPGDDLSGPVVRYFSRLDADIGRLVAEAGPDTTVMIMSDHGMGQASRFVVLNNLLLEAGFLKLGGDIVTRLKTLAFRGGFTLRNVHRLADALGLAKHAEYKNVYSFDAVLKRFFLSFANVDWERTQAYSYGRHYGSVFLNLKGREPRGAVDVSDYHGVRDRLAEAMMSWKDPRLGRPLVSRCIRREDVYSGERFGEAPDLILLPEDPSDIFFGLSDFGSNRVWDDTYRYSGMHRDQGLLISAGPGIQKGRTFAGGGIVDLAPSVLHWLGHEVPADMDGRPLESLLEESYLADNPVRVGHPSGSQQQRPHDYSRSEEEEVMERLRDLGYMN